LAKPSQTSPNCGPKHSMAWHRWATRIWLHIQTSPAGSIPFWLFWPARGVTGLCYISHHLSALWRGNAGINRWSVNVTSACTECKKEIQTPLESASLDCHWSKVRWRVALSDTFESAHSWPSIPLPSFDQRFYQRNRLTVWSPGAVPNKALSACSSSCAHTWQVLVQVLGFGRFCLPCQ
jgi:hypothetical protein